ncbi:MAG: hypothetical protein ACRDNW_23960 [Trebonia sp.]
MIYESRFGIAVVIALGVALQHIATRDALLDFAIVIAVGSLSAAPSLLVHRPQAASAAGG